MKIWREIADLAMNFEACQKTLAAMVFCGGRDRMWRAQSAWRSPRVDDCFSLVMTTTEAVNPRVKRMGHMYVFGGESKTVTRA